MKTASKVFILHDVALKQTSPISFASCERKIYEGGQRSTLQSLQKIYSSQQRTVRYDAMHCYPTCGLHPKQISTRYNVFSYCQFTILCRINATEELRSPPNLLSSYSGKPLHGVMYSVSLAHRVT